MTRYLNFMPHFGAKLAGGSKTLTFQKARQYNNLSVGGFIRLRLNKTGGYIVGIARVTDVGVGSLVLQNFTTDYGAFPELGPAWWSEHGLRPISLQVIRCDGFDDPVQFIWAHHARGFFSMNPDRPVMLRRISFQLEDPAQAAADFADYEAKLSTSPHPVLF